MYREPHLQKKSEECKILWNIWYNMMEDKNPLEPTARKTWIKCSDEFSEMIHQEYLTNDKYKNLSDIHNKVI